MGGIEGRVTGKGWRSGRSKSKSYSDSMGGDQAPSPAPVTKEAPPVVQESQRSTANTGRSVGNILDPVLANEDENKQVLG